MFSLDAKKKTYQSLRSFFYAQGSINKKQIKAEIIKSFI